MTHRLILPRRILNGMKEYVASHAPLEACGLLAGKDERVEHMIEVQNQAHSPIRFVMDPHEQLKALAYIESNQLELLGIFHSHPAGPGSVSSTDIAEAAYDAVHVILARNGTDWTAHGFWIESGTAVEVPLQIVE